MKISKLADAVSRFRIVLATAFMVIFMLFSASEQASAQMGPDYWKVHGVASDDYLNIRTGPGTSSRVVAHAPNGAVFRNLGCRGEGNSRWCHLETPDGRVNGWAAGRYLQESGAPGTASHESNDVPELHVRQSGEIEVRFAAGCTALYNPVGRRINAGSSCSRAQLSQAHDAVERHNRESGASDAASSPATADVNVEGSGTIIGGMRLKGSVIGHREGHYAMVISGEGLVCTAALKHAPGSVGSEVSSIHCTDGTHGVVTVSPQKKGSLARFNMTDGTSGWVIFM